MIRSIRTVHITTQFGDGTLPPLNPVPDPRVTTSKPTRFASFTIAATCSVFSTNKTHPGNCDIAAVPSNPYGIKSSFARRTFFTPTIPSNSPQGISTSLPSTCVATDIRKEQDYYQTKRTEETFTLPPPFLRAPLSHQFPPHFICARLVHCWQQRIDRVAAMNSFAAHKHPIRNFVLLDLPVLPHLYIFYDPGIVSYLPCKFAVRISHVRKPKVLSSVFVRDGCLYRKRIRIVRRQDF